LTDSSGQEPGERPSTNSPLKWRPRKASPQRCLTRRLNLLVYANQRRECDARIKISYMNAKLVGPIRALVFDLDGTLIDSKQDLVLSVNATLRAIGREELPTELVASYVGSGAPVLISRALGQQADPDLLKPSLKFFLEYYEEHKLDHTREYPGVREALQQLNGTPMAVLTNKPVNMSVRILEGLRLAHFFKAIYGGNSFTTKKPDPLGANTVLGDLKVTASEAAMVGDSEVD